MRWNDQLKTEMPTPLQITTDIEAETYLDNDIGHLICVNSYTFHKLIAYI